MEIEPAFHISTSQVVPNAAASTVLVQGAAFDQRAEMLFKRVAAGASELDGIAGNTSLTGSLKQG